MSWMLKGLKTNSGFLEECPIDFTPGLNCIIGARGTCKSTVVETVRFVFDCDPARVAELVTHLKPGPQNEVAPPRTGLIVATLRGGVATCVIGKSGDQTETEFTIERTTGGPPRVFQDGVEQIEPADQLQQIEIYSQGDLLSLAENAARRLALVDRPNQGRLVSLLRDQKRYTKRLKLIGESLRDRKPEIDSKTASIRGLNLNRQQLAELTASGPKLSAELESEKQAYEGRRAIYDTLSKALAARQRVLSALRECLPEEFEGLAEAADTAQGLCSEAGTQIANEVKRLISVSGKLADFIVDSPDLAPSLQEVKNQFETESRAYYELRKVQQEANEALKKQDALRQAIQGMESVEKKLLKLRAENDLDLEERRKLRARRDAIANEIYEMRVSEVESINSLYRDQIILTLEPGVMSNDHLSLIKTLLQRSNLRNQEDVAKDLAEKIPPSDLIDMVETGDAKGLAEALNRDQGQMTRLISHLMDTPELYGLETVIPEDFLQITMVVQGESRPLHQLSKGQMATALLPLVLRAADYPLVIDQPEDDLDNAFVFEKLINNISKLSEQRQLIFVTHNANIPVLGNAANVIVMEMEGPRKATPPRRGTVEERKADIIKILEGGKLAFRSRQQRYGKALN